MTTTTLKRRVGGYTTNPHQTLPDWLADKLRGFRDLRPGRNHVFTAAVTVVRDTDWGMPAIAAAVGQDPETLARRIERGRHNPRVRAAAALLDLAVPAPPVPSDAHPSCAPAAPLPERIAQHLRELRALSSQYRPWLDREDPVVLAARHLAVDIQELTKTYDRVAVARALGVTSNAVRNLVFRHGDPAEADAA